MLDTYTVIVRREVSNYRCVVIFQIYLYMFIIMYPHAAAADCDPATNAEIVSEARDALKPVQRFVDTINKIGVAPKALSSAVVRFGSLIRSAKMGIDLAEAAGEVDAQVQAVVSDRKRICKELPVEEQAECELKIDRAWQSRNVNAVLSWSNSRSVIRRTVAKWLGKHCDRDPKKETYKDEPTYQPTPGLCGMLGTCN